MAAELCFFPPFRLDSKNEQLWRADREIRLRRKTFAVLRYLIERPGELVTKAALLDAVWPDVSVSDSMPAISVRELRKALGDSANQPSFIETVQGRGYRFIAPVTSGVARDSKKMIVAPPSPLMPHGSQPSFVGRESERALLRTAIAHAISGRGRLVMISGEPGIGKSRLCAELADGASAKQMTVLIGQCSEQEAVPYLPFVEILERATDCAEGAEGLRRAIGEDGPELARLLPKIRRSLPDLPAPLASSGKQAQRLLFDSWYNFIARHSRKRPALVILEDLHWADDSTLALFSHLAARHSELPLLLVGTHRVSETDVRPSLAKVLEDLIRGRRATQIGLDGLSIPGVARMLKNLGHQAPPPALVREFTAETDGNPFFVEELFRHLMEENRLFDSSGRYLADLKIEDLDVPQNVRLVIGRRLARLSEATGKALATAAVIGRSFSFDLLKAATEIEAEPLLDVIDEATRNGLTRSTAKHIGARVVEFTHELIRQVVLAQLSAARHQQLHLKVAVAIERIYPDVLEDRYVELAYHYRQTTDALKAAKYLCLAGQQALHRSAHAEALALLSSGIERLSAVPESLARDGMELTAQLAIGDLMIAIKGFGVPEVEIAFNRAAMLAHRTEDRPSLLSAKLGLAVHHMLRSRLRKGLAMGKEVLALLDSADTPEQKVRGHFYFAMPSFWLGDFIAAREHLETAVALCAVIPEKRIIGVQPGCLQYLAWTLWYMGNPDCGLSAARRALVLARSSDHPFTLASALNQVARFHILRREAHIALELANEGLAFSNRYGFPTWAAESTLVRGWALAATGHVSEGVAELRAGLAARDAIREFGAQPHYKGWLAEACGRIGRVEEGLELIASVLDREHEILVYEPELHMVRASLLLVRDPTVTEEASNCMRTALEIAKGHGSKSWELRATLGLARLLRDTNRREEAGSMLADIYGWFTEGFDTADLKDAKALLKEFADK